MILTSIDASDKTSAPVNGFKGGQADNGRMRIRSGSTSGTEIKARSVPGTFPLNDRNDCDITDNNTGLAGDKPQSKPNKRKKVARPTAPEKLPRKPQNQETIQPEFADVSSPEAVGAFLRAARERKGMTQVQVAEIMGTGQRAVGRIERGEQSIGLAMIAKYAAAVDFPLALCPASHHN